MTFVEPEEDLPPIAHVTIRYTGPVAPHWELRSHFGDEKMLENFWTRVTARLLLLPKHDPQFRRNRERVNRDAERELIICDWDLGEDDAETTSTSPSEVQAQVAPEPPAELEEVEVEAQPEPVPEEVAQASVEEVPMEASAEPEVSATDTPLEVAE